MKLAICALSTPVHGPAARAHCNCPVFVLRGDMRSLMRLHGHMYDRVFLQKVNLGEGVALL